MEVGNLSVPVSANLGPITADLERLKKLLGQTEGQTTGVTNAMRGVERQSRGLTSALGPLATALAGVLGVRQLIQFADTWSDISGRVGQAIGNLDNVPAVMARIADTARRTYSNLNLTAEGFVRNSTVLKELGLSTQQQLDYQEALNNALVVSGARGRAAEFVQESLNRALALGKVRGIELNNVLNYGGRVAQLLAERFNTTTGGLMKLAQEGKITGQVIQEVLIGNVEKLREEADALDATIGDAFVLLGNALLQAIGQLDQTSGVSLKLAEALIFVADNMQRLLTYVATGAVGWAAYNAYLAITQSQLYLTAGAAGVARAAFIRLAAATGIGLIIVAIGELIYQFTQIVSATGGFGKALELLGEVASGVWQGIVTSASAIPVGLQAIWATVRADFALTIRDLGSQWNNFLKIFEGPALTVTAGGRTFELLGGLDLSGFKADIRGAVSEAARLRQEAGKLQTQAGSLAKEGFDKARESLAKLNVEVEKNAIDLSGDGGTNRVVADTGDGKKTKAQRDAERLKEAYQDLIRDSQAFIASQEIEQQAIGMTELEAAKLRATFDLLNAAQRAGITLTAAQTEELTNLAHQMAEAEHATNKLREQYDFAKDTFKGFFGDLKSELQNGASIWEAFGTAAANALQKIADKALDLALNGIFDLIFGAFSSGIGGSGGGIGGFFSNLFKAENGTSFAPGGVTLVGERGPELVRLPGGAQVTPNNRVTAPSQASFGGASSQSNGYVAIDIYVKDDGKIGAIAREEAGGVVEVALHDYDERVLPDSVNRIRESPRMR